MPFFGSNKNFNFFDEEIFENYSKLHKFLNIFFIVLNNLLFLEIERKRKRIMPALRIFGRKWYVYVKN